MDPGARCTRAASARGVRDQTNHVPHPMKNANIPHDRIQFVHSSPPCSAKSSSTAQSKTVSEQPDATSPANANPILCLSFNPVNASAMNAPHTHPTNHPHSARSVRCALTSVRTSGTPSSNRNAEASVPELQSPTPPGFAAKSRSPASQIFGRFRIEPSSARRGPSDQRESPTTASPATAHGHRRRRGARAVHPHDGPRTTTRPPPPDPSRESPSATASGGASRTAPPQASTRARHAAASPSTAAEARTAPPPRGSGS